jgi:hypothetical protein
MMRLSPRAQFLAGVVSTLLFLALLIAIAGAVA